MPIKVRLHNSTSEVKASGDSGTIADKRLEILLNKEIERAMAEEAHLQDEIDDISGYSARDIRVDLQSDGSIEISLLNDAGEDVGHTRTIEITKKIIKEASLNYSESKVVFTCEDDSTIELDISDIVSAIHQLEDDLVAEVARATNAEEALDTRIDNLDLSQVGSDGGYIKTISQADGQVSASRQAFDTTINVSSTNNNAPTSLAVKDYVDTYGGKIDTISIKNEPLSIVNKNVEVPAVRFDINNQGLSTTQKANAKTNLDLNNVDNTSDVDKPISIATQSALDNKVDKKTTSGNFVYAHNTASQSEVSYTTSDTASTIVQRDANKQINVAQTPTNDSHATSKKYVDTQVSGVAEDLSNHKGDKNNPHEVTKSQVGLGNVDNTSDATKKTNFTGAIASENDGFVLGGDAYTALGQKQDNITSSNKLSSDLVDDTNNTHKFATSEQLTQISTNATNISNHTSNTNNPHSVTATQVGLGNVVNTGDSATPTSGGTTKFTTGGAYTELNKKVDKVDTGNKVYATDNVGSQTTISIDQGASYDGNIVRRDSNSQIHVPQTPTANDHATSKKYVDDKIADIQRDAYKVVDTTQYPTLNDFLASSGQEGYLYLYPINTSDLSQGYYRYIWENNAWLGLGTTVIDLSDYYTKTETNTLLDGKVDKIAGKGLSTEDFTTAEKIKLSGIETGAEVNDIVGVQRNGVDLTIDANRKVNVSVPTKTSDITNDSDFTTNNYVDTELGKKQNTIDSTHKLSSDLVDDTNNTHLFVSSSEKSTWNAKQDAIDSSHKLSSDLVDDTNKTHKFTTTADITKLSGIETGAQVNVIETIKVDNIALTPSSKAVNIDLSGYAKSSDLATVATSGSYADLLNKPHLASYVDTSAGRIAYLEDVNYTSASASGTDTFVKSINGGSGTFSATTKYLGVDYTAGSAITSTTKKYMEFTAPVLATSTAYEISDVGSLPSLTISDSSSSGSTAFVSGISSTGASGTGKYMHFSAGTTPPSSASPSHTSTTSGSNSGTNFNAVTGYPNFSGGSGSLTSNDTSSDGIKYISEASHTAASLGTASTGTVSISGGSYSLSSTRTTSGSGSSARRSLTISLSGSAPTLGGTKTFVTGYPNFSGGSASHTTKYLHHSHTGASLGTPSTSSASPGNHTHSYDKTTSVSLTSGTAPSLTFNSTSTGGEYYVTSVSGGTTSATTKYMAFSAGSLPTRSSFTYATGSFSTAASLNFDASELRVNAHPYISNATSGSVIGGSVSLSTYDSSDTGRVKYLQDATHTHTAASVATSGSAVTGITSGSVTKTTKYLDLDEPSE